MGIQKKKQDNIGVSPLKQKGNLISDSKGKADILVEQFQSVFTKITDSIMPNMSNRTIPKMDEIVIDNKGVEKLLSNLKTSKSTGPDSIPNLVLKTCATELSMGLSTIFQYSIDIGSLPSDWRDANISPVFKKGDRHLAENYRPVSLTSISCKLLEHILCSQILKHFEQFNVLTKLNHGFRSGFSTETQLLVTLQDLLKSFDKKIQMDVAILDFSKAFDTVPHDKLLYKMNRYGVQGNTLKWLSSFLKDRTMKVVVEGEESKSVKVESGVPQGTVLGPLMFLCHINDLPDSVQSQVRLFADDCLLYRPIKSPKDHELLQNDLRELEKWASRWGMRFNAKKCYVMSIRNTSSHFYELDNTILQQVTSNPYLGITLSEDLQWSTHIQNITKKANSTLGFLRRNLKNCPEECRKLAYISLVRSTLEYESSIWDPYLQKDINSIEKVQRQAARFIKRDYKSREEGCVTNMLNDLDLPSLQQRREFNKLVFLFKIAGGMVPAINSCDYLTPQKPKRRIKAKQFSDYQCSNLVDKNVTNNSSCFVVNNFGTAQFRHSFFIDSVIKWNHLPDSIVHAETVESFKAALHTRD